MSKQNFYDLNFDQLKNFLIEKAEIDYKKAKMRAQQMFNAVYKKNVFKTISIGRKLYYSWRLRSKKTEIRNFQWSHSNGN
mgnify:CR=1 FL=1